jgi:hypothetical protein
MRSRVVYFQIKFIEVNISDFSPFYLDELLCHALRHKSLINCR